VYKLTIGLPLKAAGESWVQGNNPCLSYYATHFLYGIFYLSVSLFAPFNDSPWYKRRKRVLKSLINLKMSFSAGHTAGFATAFCSKK
jgi:hypothetical protein